MAFDLSVLIGIYLFLTCMMGKPSCELRKINYYGCRFLSRCLQDLSTCKECTCMSTRKNNKFWWSVIFIWEGEYMKPGWYTLHFYQKNDKLNYRKTTVSLQVVQTNYIKSSYLRMCAFELKRFPTIGVWWTRFLI